MDTIGGVSIPGIGVAIGLERVLIALENQGVQLPLEQKKIIYIATAGEDPEGKLDRDAVLLLLELRKAGFAAEKDLMGRSLKAQMKFAGRLGASYVVIFGLEEIQQGRLLLRDMLKGEQVELPKNGLVEYLKSLLN